MERKLTVGELKKFLEATDDNVLVSVAVVTDYGMFGGIAVEVKDLEPGVIELVGSQ